MNILRILALCTQGVRYIVSFLIDDVVLLLAALFLVPLAYFCPAPVREISLRHKTKPTTGMGSDTRPAILLLHGSGFNWTEWLVGIFYLCVMRRSRQGKRHRVYTMNYDGLLSNTAAAGIDDHARGRVREKIQSIFADQGIGGDVNMASKRLIIIGHSMGGLIGEYYASQVATLDGVKVVGLFTIASPWQGSPLLTWLTNTFNHLRVSFCGRFVNNFFNTEKNKRYQQMVVGSPFLEQLRINAAASGRMYGFAGSSVDVMVPSPRHAPCFSTTTTTHYQSHWLGHYALIASPFLWARIGSWLDKVEKI